MKFIFVCGGTAGHINPAIAIAEELSSRLPQAEILFVGADKVLEKKLIPQAGFELINIKMSGLRRGFSPEDVLHNIKTAVNLLIAYNKSGRLLKKFMPDAVIGTGGYICYPVLKKAAKKKILTFILEPNASPGMTVRMLSTIVDRIFVSYKGLEQKYKEPKRVVYTGTPLKKGFFSESAEQDSDESQPEKEKPLVISYWGSVGAAGMNIKILDFIKLNTAEESFNHIHATGAGGSLSNILEQLKEKGVASPTPPTEDIREYIDDMPSVMRNADIVISRSGASTIAEITALGKPAILIPSPNVTENHQEENARQLQAAGGAVMILENECTGDILYNKVVSILDDKNELSRMSNAQKSLSVQDAAARVIENVLE